MGAAHLAEKETDARLSRRAAEQIDAHFASLRTLLAERVPRAGGAAASGPAEMGQMAAWAARC